MELTFPTTPREAGRGILISFLPLRAGAGAATLACMTGLIACNHYDTSIVDLNQDSKVRSYLGFQDLSASTVSILDINGVATPEGIFSASEQHHSGLKVFPGVSPRVLDASQIDTQLTLKAVTYLKKTSPLTIAVINPLHSSWMAAMLSDMVCLVAKPDRPNMDAFRETTDFLNRLGCSDRLKIIVNQTGYTGGLEVKGAINYYSPDMVIGYDKFIPEMSNRRVLEPNKKMRAELFSLVKEVIADA